MPLLIDQERVVVRPGEPLAATVWVENDTGAAGSFDLRLEAADPTLSDDWYEVAIEPAGAKNIPANARDSFKVRITPLRSPDGRTRLIELVVRARSARAGGAYRGPVRQANAPQPGRNAPPPMTDLEAAIFSAFNPTPTAGDSEPYDPISAHEAGYEDEATPSGPSADPYDNNPMAGIFDPRPGSKSTPPKDSLTNLRDNQQGRTTIEIPFQGGSSAAAATIDNQAESGAAGGRYGSDMVGSIFLFVPPIPAFTIDITPYEPETSTGKKSGKKSAATGEKSRVVSDRERGQFAVRVTNNSEFPASFRLTSEGDDDCSYFLREQLLRIQPRSSESTVITAEPLGLNWWRWVRPFGFAVTTTPLTGAMQIDTQSAAQERGAFRQTLAWLHPAPLAALLVGLLLLLGPLTQPNIRAFDAQGRYVLQEPFEGQYIVNPGEEARAPKDLHFSDNAQTTLSWTVDRARGVKLERSSAGSEDWTEIKLSADDLQARKFTSRLPQQGIYKFRLRAVPWLWGGDESEVEVELTKTAKNVLIVPSEKHVLPGKVPVGGERSFTIRLYNRGEKGFHLYQVSSLLSDPKNFSLITPAPPLTAQIQNPQNKDGYPFEFQYHPKAAGTHTCVVTVITNAAGGNVKQYEIVGKAE